MKTRITASLFCAILGLSGSGQAIADPVPLVRTEGGQLQGAIENGVVSWKAIPFAAPPIGPLRWRAPQPVVPWTGVRDAGAYAHDCMQLPFAGDAAPLGTPPDEDCLYANIWRPSAKVRALPVVVWIYGGGFVNGGASPPTYSGAEMARKDVLFFSFNYRLGRFATFVHPQLTRENADNGLLGNYNFMDQLAALRWVQRNIATFGGDPANVTLIGESAGGMSINTLLTSPLAKGLFAKAVIMSGGDGTAISPDSGASNDAANNEAKTLAFARKHGIADDDPDALAKLRALPADQVVDGLNLMQMFRDRTTVPGPYPDGKLAVPTGPAYAAGAFAHVPVMIGATSNDIGGPNGMMIAGARRTASAIAAHGLPVYAYRFSYVAQSAPPSKYGSGAGHATDIPFFFDTQAVKYGAGTTARDNGMGDTISSYIVNFARSGNPNGGQLPRWARYDPAKDEIMDFSANGLAVPERDPWGPGAKSAP